MSSSYRASASAGLAALAEHSSSKHAYAIRGIYEHEADPEFATVRAFETAAEAQAWYAAPRRCCTNPTYRSCDHIYTTLCDWAQVQSLLLPKIAELRAKYPVVPPRPVAAAASGAAASSSSPAAPSLPPTNAYARDPENPVARALRERLDLPFHAVTTEESTLNTLRYLFFHMKCGIFVMIRRGKLVLFVPFVNKDYVNTWGDSLRLDSPGSSLREYIASKHDMLAELGRDGRHERYMQDVSRWWANGNIICNVEAPNFWGDSYLPQLRHMLQTLCAERDVPDAEFFINKRDFPHLKRNLTEPYDFLNERDDTPLARELYASYAPIASFFVGKDFADLPLVTTDDWETATGLVFPPHFIDIRSAKNRKAHDLPFADRTPTAFFRGNSTGPGTDTSTNQRIALARVSADWAASPAYGPGNPVDGVRFLDAGLVRWNFRDRKLQGQPMTYIKPTQRGMPVANADHVPMYAQVRYKYHVYVDGHCAAMRYASMMPLGAVILKVDSVTKADSMWYFPLLMPYDIRSPAPNPAGDHIRVAADLSDLAEVIAWCKQHDAECARIAASSKALYERLVAREGQLDYMQLLVHEVAARFRSAPHAAAEAVSAARAEAAAKGLDETGTALLAGCSPATTAPALATPPFGGGGAGAGAGAGAAAVDVWFGFDNPEYAATRIGPSAAAPPILPDLATAACACPACAKKRAAAEQLAVSGAAAAARGAGAGFAGAGAGAWSGAGGAGGRGGSSSAAAPAAPAGPRIANLEKARAAAQRAAALAKEKERERDPAAEGDAAALAKRSRKG
jgi:hypothetical protein